MASKTSEKFKVNRETAGGDSYYVTDVTTLADGSVRRETFRSDANGNNKVLVQTVEIDKDENITKDTLTSNATVNEQRDLKNPNSIMSKGIKTSVNSVKKDLVANNIDGVTESTIEKAAGGSGNTATKEDKTTEESRPAPAANTPSDAAVGTTKDSDFGEHRYPLSMNEQQDCIKIDMVKFRPRGLQGLSAGTRTAGKIIGSVTLPIPNGIQDANGCDWGVDSLDPVALAGMAVASSTISNGVEGGSGQIGQIMRDIQGSAGQAKQAITATFGAAAVGGNKNQLLGRLSGNILNPNMELLFQAPTLRSFTFTFKLSPREAAESKAIQNIIRFFKQGMAPIRTQAKFFLSSPHTFLLTYHQMNQESKYLNKFKECALLSCGVQYAPDGSYATYSDGAMSSYLMTLQFKELEPVFNDEYKENEIGF